MTFSLSKKLDVVLPSPTLAITRKAAEMRAQGLDIISLSQGEPDFDTPVHIRDAAKAALDAGATRYTTVDGTPELKQAIIAKFQRENHLTYLPEQISVGTGGKQILFNAFMASLNEGDEVIIPAPYWVSYPDMVRLAGGTPVPVPCPERNAFKLSPAQLRAAITPRTKWLILNSPSNPAGSAYSAGELAELARVLLDFPDIYVMTDEIYEHIHYDGWEPCSIAAVEPRLLSRTLTCNGVSKAFAMTGWRIGYGGGPAPLIRAMATIQSQSTSNPNSIAQAASVAALDGPMDFLPERNAIFKHRRDMAAGIFNSTPGLSCRFPEGAFYLFPSCAGLIGKRTPKGKVLESDTDVAGFLLEDAMVAVVPGAAFGLSPFFRISFATATERLEAACERIRDACRRLR
ncbi:MAG: pyridoxal phosphate-dependent aminotransferase [Holophaga sp.]|nr:pyridoxal phosphate-dependent aminotransferase [Holophaga sp.]